ncbi:hypothetical protein Sa4125_40870 [Aureimonas sp. SA4125]|uniref:hypothetical protein n=1 Tax=Aureimonas sp. SA4125 TaxID=2826993 RepID=UPI001CC698B1|nr:hypothetical protein [Aureimonas sp. SA4125]BDA86545.1 hypothetical protein Sa4125_40870 [Aureimonas sp. SA4125]
MHEFSERWVHPIEAERLAQPSGSLLSEDMPLDLREKFVAAGYPPLGTYLIHALPYEGYDPASYRIQPAPATRQIREGETVNLGDRQFEVLLARSLAGQHRAVRARHRHPVCRRHHL